MNKPVWNASPASSRSPVPPLSAATRPRPGRWPCRLRPSARASSGWSSSSGCALLLHEAEEIEQAAAAARAEPSGTLEVTDPLPIGVHLLAPALPRLREGHPRLSIDLRLGDHIVDIIEEGIDVAIRVGEHGDPRLIARRLAPCRLCAFAPPACLAKRGTPRHPEDLRRVLDWAI